MGNRGGGPRPSRLAVLTSNPLLPAPGGAPRAPAPRTAARHNLPRRQGLRCRPASAGPPGTALAVTPRPSLTWRLPARSGPPSPGSRSPADAVPFPRFRAAPGRPVLDGRVLLVAAVPRLPSLLLRQRRVPGRGGRPRPAETRSRGARPVSLAAASTGSGPAARADAPAGLAERPLPALGSAGPGPGLTLSRQARPSRPVPKVGWDCLRGRSAGRIGRSGIPPDQPRRRCRRRGAVRPSRPGCGRGS